MQIEILKRKDIKAEWEYDFVLFKEVLFIPVCFYLGEEKKYHELIIKYDCKDFVLDQLYIYDLYNESIYKKYREKEIKEESALKKIIEEVWKKIRVGLLFDIPEKPMFCIECKRKVKMMFVENRIFGKEKLKDKCYYCEKKLTKEKVKEALQTYYDKEDKNKLKTPIDHYNRRFVIEEIQKCEFGRKKVKEKQKNA